ncbi:MAG: hypothetical protein ABI744_05460 [Chloroflexota bacterium]
MPPDINVPTDPMIVYAIVGVLIGAIVLALVFARPRRGLGAATEADAAHKSTADGVWMPGGDIFGSEPAAPQPAQVEPAFTDPITGPLAYPPSDYPPDPWSTTEDPSGQQPRWDRR